MLNHLRCVLIFTLVISFVCLTPVRPARADGCFGLTSLGATYTQNFDTLATSGTTNTTASLPLGWTLTESGGSAQDNEQYAAGTGSDNTGDTYSFGTTSERAFGGLQSGSLIPVIGVCFTNNTGSTLNSLRIVYTGEAWRFGTTGRTDQLDFQYSTNASSLTTGAWTDVNALDFTTPNTSGSAGARDGNGPANRAVPNATITGLTIANGANFWLRWNDFNATSNDDGLALDNFSLTPLAASTVVGAAKTDALATDTDGDTQADPGDVLSYTIVISNSGATATGLTVSDTLDANTSQNGLVGVSPVAFDDNYNASANPITLAIPDGASDLFTNDYPGLNPSVTGIASFGGGSLTGDAGANAAGSTVTFGTGGSLTVNANGSFNFTPPAGYQGIFGFFYRLQNSLGPSDGLATIVVDAPPTVTSTSPTNGATNVNAASNITLTFTENVDIAAGGITLDCGAGAVSFTPALPQNGVTTLVLDPASNLPGLATCTVTILAANTTDSDTNDPPNNLDGNGDGSEGDNYVFTFQVAPTANDDSYNVTPHLTLNAIPANDVTANDDPTTVTITGFGATLGTANGTVPNGTNSITTGLGGTVILNTDGTFTFNPPPDQRNVNDAFFYTITGGDTANVTLAIQNQNLVWFVDASASPSGNGTQARPFNLLTGAGSFDAVASDNTGDFIFIADGSYTCGLTLLNNQTVVGDGSSSSLQTISGVTLVSGSSFPPFSGIDPTLSNSGGDCLTLGSGNTLRGLTIGNTSATGSDITGTNFGTLTVTETTLNGTGRALNLNNGTFNATLDGLTSTSGTNNINLISVSGTANLGNGALSGASGTAFNVSGGNASITYNGTTSKTSAGRLVDIQSRSGGSVTLAGNLSCSTSCTGLNVASNTGGTMTFSGASKIVNTGAITAVTLSSNTGATINFTGGGLDIDTTSGNGFSASGGGTVTVQGTVNTINSTTGIALNVVNTTIGASGLTFQSISANGAVNGIVLNNTGSGGLNVTGNGGSCSSATPTCTGGTIANVTDTGISLTNASNVSLTRMRIQNSPNFGLNGSTVNTMNIDTCLFDGTHGSAIDEGALFVTNWFGSGTISNSEITGGFNDNVRVNNTASGTLNRLTVSNTTIRNSGNNHGFAFYGCLNGSAGSCPATTMNLSVLNSTFTDNSSNSVNVSLASATSSDVVLQGNLFQSTSLVTVGGPGGSVLLAIDHSSTMTLDVNGNTFTNPRLSAFTAFISNQTTSAASMVGKIRNNIIGTSGVDLSGSRQGSGMQLTATGAAAMTLNVTGNTIRNWATNNGIDLSSGDAVNGSPNVNVTITGNTLHLDSPTVNQLHGISANMGTTSTGFPVNACVDIGGTGLQNNVTGSIGSGGGSEIRVRQRFAANVRLPGFPGPNNNGSSSASAAVTYLNGRNTGAPNTTVTVNATGAAGTGTFTGGAACTAAP